MKKIEINDTKVSHNFCAQVCHCNYCICVYATSFFNYCTTQVDDRNDVGNYGKSGCCNGLNSDCHLFCCSLVACSDQVCVDDDDDNMGNQGAYLHVSWSLRQSCNSQITKRGTFFSSFLANLLLVVKRENYMPVTH